MYLSVQIINAVINYDCRQTTKNKVKVKRKRKKKLYYSNNF